MSKKGDFGNPKVPNRDFIVNQYSISAVCWGPKNRTNRGIPVKSLFIKASIGLE